VLDVVAAICFDDAGRVLVSRQWCHGPQRIVLELPAGGVEAGEEHEDAIRRELMEEVGLHAAELFPLGRYLRRKRRSPAMTWIFEARGLTLRSLKSDDAEIIDFAWYTMAEIERMIATDEIEDGSLLAGWTLLRVKRPELF
jgi:ADP-ribose pyrophosphatase